jgi:RNA polymerase sigma-70 factor (ECF subfamily)
MDDLLLQVEPMIPALRRYSRGLLKDRETADDIVQDCLV